MIRNQAYDNAVVPRAVQKQCEPRLQHAANIQNGFLREYIYNKVSWRIMRRPVSI